MNSLQKNDHTLHQISSHQSSAVTGNFMDTPIPHIRRKFMNETHPAITKYFMNQSDPSKTGNSQNEHHRNE